MLLRRNRPDWQSVRRARSLACAFSLLLSPPLFAQSSSDDLARRHFDSGAAYLEESDYENALKAFEKSYELSKRPEILVNIATVHERRGELARAQDALRAYLEAAPNGDLVATIQLRLENLRKRAGDAAQPVAATPEPAPKASPVAAPTATSPSPRSSPSQPAVGAGRASPSRMPAFIALGAGGLLGGAALVTGLMAQNAYDEAQDGCSPGCSDDEIASARGLAVTSTVLTGGAAIGIGLGVVLLLTTGPEPDGQSTRRPRLNVALDSHGAAASAAWTF